MPDPNHQDLARAVIDRYKERAREYAKAIASKLGQPVSGQEVSRGEMVRLWSVRSAAYRQDPEGTLAQAQALMAQGQFGQAVDLVYPWRSKLFRAPTIREVVEQAETLHQLANGQNEETRV